MSTTLVTRAQFEYSIMATFSEFAGNIADRLMLTEVREQELRKFKTVNICVSCINDYFHRYDGEIPPTDDKNMMDQSQIEDIVQLYNTLMGTNYWYEFPKDN